MPSSRPTKTHLLRAGAERRAWCGARPTQLTVRLTTRVDEVTCLGCLRWLGAAQAREASKDGHPSGGRGV